MVELLKPLKGWMTLLRRKGAAACLSGIVPVFEDLIRHLQTQWEHHSATDASIYIPNSLHAAEILLKEYVLLTSFYYPLV